MQGRLHDKIAVITGPTSGIGLATLELFVQEGARILAIDREIDAGHDLASRFPGAVHFAPCDVTQTAQLKSAIVTAASHFGGLDILFNNAGSGGARATVEEFDPTGWDDTMALLLRAVAAGTAYAVPHMKRRGGARVCGHPHFRARHWIGARSCKAQNPLGHIEQSSDIAQAVLFLASDASSYITGTHIVIDGGSTIGPRHSWDPTVNSPMTAKAS